MINFEKFLYKAMVSKSQKKFIEFNKKIFKKFEKFKRSEVKEIFLIEFNAFQDYHGVFTALSYHLKSKYKINIVGYFNYSLVVTPLNFNFINSLKWTLGKIFNLKTFAVYKSFGTDEFLKPKIKNNNRLQAKKFFYKNYNLIKSKENITNLKFKNILIGDLLYDSFIKYSLNTETGTLGTVDFKNKNFKEYFLNFIELADYWHEYFTKNKVRGIVACQGSYAHGLPMRVATHKNSEAYIMRIKELFKYNKKTFHAGWAGDFKNYKSDFKKLPKNIKINGIKEAKKQISLRFKGHTGPKVNRDNENLSSFNKKRQPRLLERNKKLNVLVCPHDFFDAIHLYGSSFFVDFYEWLLFLGKISKITNYNWYIKNHPNWSGRYTRYQGFSEVILNKFLKKYSNFKLLKNDTSMHQLINEKLDVVLTVYGTVAMEFPHFSIPVLNANKNNPASGFNFSKTPLSKKEYINHLMNLSKLKTPKNAKNEIYIYYFMRYILPNTNWLFPNFNSFMLKLGGYHNLSTRFFYEYWVKNMNEKKIINASENINKFISSNSLRFLSK